MLGPSGMVMNNCLTNILLYKSEYIPEIWLLLFEKKNKEEAAVFTLSRSCLISCCCHVFDCLC